MNDGEIKECGGGTSLDLPPQQQLPLSGDRGGSPKRFPVPVSFISVVLIFFTIHGLIRTLDSL